MLSIINLLHRLSVLNLLQAAYQRKLGLVIFGLILARLMMILILSIAWVINRQVIITRVTTTHEQSLVQTEFFVGWWFLRNKFLLIQAWRRLDVLIQWLGVELVPRSLAVYLLLLLCIVVNWRVIILWLHCLLCKVAFATPAEPIRLQLIAEPVCVVLFLICWEEELVFQIWEIRALVGLTMSFTNLELMFLNDELWSWL